MRKMKTNVERPWLTSTGVEVSTAELRQISKSWNAATWENYLEWFETSRQEQLILPAAYEMTGDEQTESIFEQFNQSPCPETQALSDQALSQLPKNEKDILTKIFFEGRTIREIAAIEGLPKTSVHNNKIRYIRRMKQGLQGDGWDTRRFMRGESFKTESEEASIWDQPLSQPLSRFQKYDPDEYKKEFEAISSSSVQIALLELSERAQRILYLRHWCGLSVNETDRILRIGVNNIEQIEAASITKLKRNAIAYETGSQFGGAK